MTNIVESFDIADKIIDELSSHHDQFYTIQQIHSVLYEKYNEFKRLDIKKDLINKLKITFMTIEGEYNNIYRIVKNEKHYLIWSLKEKETILKEINFNSPQKLSDTVIVDKEYEDLDNFLTFSSNKDYVSIIKQMVEQKNYSFMYDTNYMNGINHPIHILILNNEYDLIQKLDELTIIDYALKNREGKSCSDLAKETNNCILLEFILKKNFSNKTKQYVKIIEDLKESQKSDYDKITVLTKKNSFLEEEIKKMKSDDIIGFFKNFIIFILLGVCLNKST